MGRDWRKQNKLELKIIKQKLKLKLKKTNAVSRYIFDLYEIK